MPDAPNRGKRHVTVTARVTGLGGRTHVVATDFELVAMQRWIAGLASQPVVNGSWTRLVGPRRIMKGCFVGQEDDIVPRWLRVVEGMRASPQNAC